MNAPRARFGWVLAGGASTRMGEDKALLAWGDATLLEHAVALLEHAGAESVRVSGRAEHAGSIQDDEPGLGPLGGLATLSRRCPDGEVWVVAVDAPQVTVEDLHALSAGGARQACCFEGFPLPMWLRLDEAMRASLQRACEEPEAAHRALHAWQDAQQALRLPCAEDRARRLRGANTPHEWAALRA